MPISHTMFPIEPKEVPVRTAVSDIARAHGGHVKWMNDGSLVVTLAGLKPVTDLVQAGARCALAIAKVWQAAQVSLATGRGALTHEAPSGEVIARAFMLARRIPSGHTQGSDTLLNGKAASAPAIFIDDASTGLLDGRYQLDRKEHGAILVTGEFNPDEGRRLLGKPTPCVGRERELALLKGLFDDCTGDEPRAQAVTSRAHRLVTAARRKNHNDSKCFS